MRIAMFQGPAASDVAGSLDEVAAAAADAAARGAEILVCAELTCTGYREHRTAEPRPDDGPRGPIATAMAQAARDAGLAIAYGYSELDQTDDVLLHNSVAVIGRGGDVLAHYRKTHLYRPTGGADGSPDDRPFVPGTDLVVQFPLGGLTCGVLICYDVEFPEAVRAHALAGTDWLLVPTALAHPDTQVATVLVPARAIESQMFVTYVNRVGTEHRDDAGNRDGGGAPVVYCGLSCTVGPDGVELSRAGDVPVVLVTDLDPERLAASRRRNPYLRDRRVDLYRGPS
ncbi:nitrilase-related carbon-nitrogen hydrolase [Gordonia phthalatica]|uniref:Hydrolase n=1 Tax=Gordonia phthalatica TaxID=1136941 RepID=A0A0N7FUP0_9ACTN|nr:nitrilase-related carbon-nitrogen hydrolase [Gordonia phthalatica]ALG84895.1 hydrolase [Gordonia phthalatica]